MGLFGSKKEGGILDVIRCDLSDYLVWKWSPNGEGGSRKENSIRYGSSLRVKDGEVAVFVYSQKDGTMQDFIEGPFDQTIKTANFPVLTGIVGSAFGGSSPFQAEIYFINLAGTLQIPIFIPRVTLFDPRVPKLGIPASFVGNVTFKITDYRSFIKIHRMIQFTLSDFEKKVKFALTTSVTDAIANGCKIPGMESIDQISNHYKELKLSLEEQIRPELEKDFGIDVVRVDIGSINIDEESNNFKTIAKLNYQFDATIEEQTKGIRAEGTAYQRNVLDQQAVNIEHQAEAFRIQREETQRLQRLQTESANLTAHQIDVQGAVGVTAAESLGKLGGSAGSSMGGGGGDGMNPAAMMTGMMMGGAVGGSMSNMMGNMMQGVNTPQPPAPPAGAIAQYHISVNGQQAGPYTTDQLRQMMAGGQFGKQTYVWKQGMAGWEQAQNMQELSGLFAAVPPPPPQGPSTPPPPPADNL